MADLEQMIYLAATRPRDGSPYIPKGILLANRWISAIGPLGAERVCAKLVANLDIEANKLEYRHEAEMTAVRNNTDPDGNSFHFGA